MGINKLFLKTILFGSLLTGCASEQIQIELLYERALSQKKIDKSKLELDTSKLEEKIKEIIVLNKIKDVHSVHIYHPLQQTKFISGLKQYINQNLLQNLTKHFDRIQEDTGFYLLYGENRPQSIIIGILPGLRKSVKKKEDLESLLKFYIAHKIKEHSTGVVMNGETLDKSIMFSTEIKKMIYYNILDYRAVLNYMIKTEQKGIKLSLENIAKMKIEYLIRKEILSIAASKGSGYAQLTLEAGQEEINSYKAQITGK